MMLDIAIDVGSGITKVWSGTTKKHFLSLSGKPEKGGFSLGGSNGAIVEFGSKKLAVGDLAKQIVHPDNLANTRDDLWFETPDYLGLLYAAMAEVLPEGYNGKVNLCTGLPQALYAKYHPRLVKRLAITHKFSVNGIGYCVHIRAPNITVMPQVMGLFLSRMSKNKALQIQKVGLVDVGTYTTGWTMVEDCKTIQWASGGTSVGVSNVIRGLSDYLGKTLRMHLTDAAITDAIRFKSVKNQNREIDLREPIDDIVFQHAEAMTEELSDLWRGGKDSNIIIGGGGAQLFAPTFSVKFPHAQIIEDDEPVYSIVDGYYTYMTQQRKQTEVA